MKLSWARTPPPPVPDSAKALLTPIWWFAFVPTFSHAVSLQDLKGVVPGRADNSFYNFDFRDLKIWGRRRKRKRCLKRDFACFQSALWLFLPTYFVKSRQTLLELEFTKRKKISSWLVSTSSIKREIRHLLVVVVQWRQRNAQKSVMHVQSCCCANQTYWPLQKIPQHTIIFFVGHFA